MAGQENSRVNFHPEIHEEEDEVWIWLPEFIIYGAGDTLVEAWADLQEETRRYIEVYLEDVAFGASVNRGLQRPHVLVAQAANTAGKLAVVLMGE